MPSPDQLRALQTQIAPAALASETATGLPAACIAGQCILESAWLALMPRNSNNPFGIKSTPHVAGRVLAWTHEWFSEAERAQFLAHDEGRTATLDPARNAVVVSGRRRYAVQDYFAAFASLADAFRYHANLLLTGAPYRAAAERYRQDQDVSAFIAAIAPHYATAPDYAEKLTEIALSKEVTEAIGALRVALTGYTQS